MGPVSKRSHKEYFDDLCSVCFIAGVSPAVNFEECIGGLLLHASWVMTKAGVFSYVLKKNN